MSGDILFPDDPCPPAFRLPGGGHTFLMERARVAAYLEQLRESAASVAEERGDATPA